MKNLKLNQLLDECNLNQKLLVERVVAILEDQIKQAEETEKKNKDEEEWFHFMGKAFIKEFIQQQDWLPSRYSWDNWIKMVRIEYKNKKAKTDKFY
jgi:hypothetical protein